MGRYLTFTAKDNAELGHQLGEHFRDRIRAKIERERHPAWEREVRQAIRHWAPTRAHFPHLCEEVTAYARAARVRWQDLWTVGLELGEDADRCTALVTNGGALVGHVEDFEPDTAHDLFLIRKTVGKATVLDLNYFYTLGGNAASVNSHGWCQLINTLHGPTSRSGVPRNVIARWLSETADPMRDARRLARIGRMDGYAHTFVHEGGRAFSLETTDKDACLKRARLPFVHANHFLSRLSEQEAFASRSSANRFAVASRKLKPRMSPRALKALMADRTGGKEAAIFNQDTIGRMIIDFRAREAQAWFKATPRRGYLAVSLDFIEKKTALG